MARARLLRGRRDYPQRTCRNSIGSHEHLRSSVWHLHHVQGRRRRRQAARSCRNSYATSSGPYEAPRSVTGGWDVAVSSAAPGVPQPGRSRACTDDTHQECGHVRFATPRRPAGAESPPSSGAAAPATRRALWAAGRRRPSRSGSVAVPALAPRMLAQRKGTQGSRCQDLKTGGKHSSASRGSGAQLGRTRSMPPAVWHRGRPATRYATYTSPNCAHEAWRYLQSRCSSKPT
jgi:hypothetical protein